MIYIFSEIFHNFKRPLNNLIQVVDRLLRVAEIAFSLLLFSFFRVGRLIDLPFFDLVFWAFSQLACCRIIVQVTSVSKDFNKRKSSGQFMVVNVCCKFFLYDSISVLAELWFSTSEGLCASSFK